MVDNNDLISLSNATQLLSSTLNEQFDDYKTLEICIENDLKAYVCYSAENFIFDINQSEIRELQYGKTISRGIIENDCEELNNNAAKDLSFLWPERMLDFYIKDLKISKQGLKSFILTRQNN